jgi:hypothetical protein
MNIVRLNRRVALAVGVLLVLGTAGCGQDPEPVASTTRQLNATEAALLAEALYGNFEAGGADFEAVAAAGPGQDSFSLRGQVDWTGLRGIADVQGGAGDAPITAVIWDTATVGERRPQLDVALLGLVSEGETPVIVRPPQKDTRRLDQVIAVITGLAAPQRDNAQLIAQTEGSAFLREDSLRGRDVLVLRYGKRNVYWLDAATGGMLRFEGTDASGRYPLLIDLLERGPRTVEVPPGAAAISVDEVAELYATVASSGP